MLKDARLRRELGADYYTSSLHQAVEICVEAARDSSIDRRQLAPIDAVR